MHIGTVLSQIGPEGFMKFSFHEEFTHSSGGSLKINNPSRELEYRSPLKIQSITYLKIHNWKTIIGSQLSRQRLVKCWTIKV